MKRTIRLHKCTEQSCHWKDRQWKEESKFSYLCLKGKKIGKFTKWLQRLKITYLWWNFIMCKSYIYTLTHMVLRRKTGSSPGPWFISFYCKECTMMASWLVASLQTELHIFTFHFRSSQKHLSPFLPEAQILKVRTLFMNNVKKTSVLALSVNTLGVTSLLSEKSSLFFQYTHRVCGKHLNLRVDSPNQLNLSVLLRTSFLRSTKEQNKLKTPYN